MSNLAYKLMNGGFLAEADVELKRALSADDFHRNVGEAVSALKDIPEDEEKKLDETFKNVEPKRALFQRLGQAIAHPDVEKLGSRWRGPDCELTVNIVDGEFIASGEYERTATSGGLSGLLTPVTKTTRYKLTYRGRILGRRVVGTVTKKAENDSSAATSLLGGLGSDGDDVEFAMIVEEDARSIAVAERQSTSPRFYTLTAAEEPIDN